MHGYAAEQALDAPGRLPLFGSNLAVSAAHRFPQLSGRPEIQVTLKKCSNQLIPAILEHHLELGVVTPQLSGSTRSCVVC